jgi:hypothetical protein
MGWADSHIEALKRGETVKFRPRGNSMTGRVNNGQLCTVAPVTAEPEKGQVVLCRVRGNQYLHLVSAVRNGQFQISNNKGRVNGWITLRSIYGTLQAVED